MGLLRAMVDMALRGFGGTGGEIRLKAGFCMKGFGGTGGGINLGVRDMRDMEIFRGVEDKWPNLAKAATSKADTVDFREVLAEVSM